MGTPMFTRINSTGGRSHARRLVGSVLLAVSVFTGAGAAEPTTPGLQVTVREEQGVFRVSAQFPVSGSPSVALNVLTDYEQIPRFMPDVRSSLVRERSGGRVVVEQEAVARMMMFSKRIYLLLEVRTDADGVHFRDSSGRSFTRYEGAWRLKQQDDVTLVRYDLSAVPRFDVPSFLLTRLLKRDATRMIERLQTEIAQRAQ
jgi:ribosome-associated toxin RatA of RatAB toxin-antitoxin module